MLHIFLPVRRYHLYKNCRPSDLYDTEMLKYSDKIPTKSATDNFDMKNISSNTEKHLEISHKTQISQNWKGIFTKMVICLRKS